MGQNVISLQEKHLPLVAQAGVQVVVEGAWEAESNSLVNVLVTTVDCCGKE